MTIFNQQKLSFFNGKRVLITGHTGFKGSWLTKILVQNKAIVCGYSLKPEPLSHFNFLELENDIESVYGDVRDQKALYETVTNFAPEIIFHLAAQPLVRASYDDPLTTFETNVMGSVNLLDAVRNTVSVRSLVYITSDKCYENVDWIWGYRENDRLGGRDPYSGSKGAAELIYSSFERSYFQNVRHLGTATVRAGNVIGGGDWAQDRIIPDCIRAIELDKPLEIRNPMATRPWQHVLEPLSGYLLLAECLYKSSKKFSGAWNFGPKTDEIRNVRDVAKEIHKVLGQGSLKEIEQNSPMYEANLLQLNCDKAHQVLGWSPRWNVDKTLLETAVWYREYLNKGDVKIVTERQINDYFNYSNA